MSEPSDLHCVHESGGLCAACQADYDEDPVAYREFGDHSEGLARRVRVGLPWLYQVENDRDYAARVAVTADVLGLKAPARCGRGRKIA